VAASPGALGADAVAADYAARGGTFATNERAERAAANRMSQLRLSAFVVAVASGIALASGRGPTPLLLAGLVIGIVAYVAAARRHATLRRRAAWAGVRRIVCEQGAFRVHRNWSAIASTLAHTPTGDHAYAVDLDVTGHASLSRLLDVTSAGPGRRALAAWLLDSVPPASELRARQEAVRELTPAVEWREALTAHAWSAGVARRSDVDRFLTWAEQSSWLLDRSAMLWAARILPFVIIPVVLLALTHFLSSVGIVARPEPSVVTTAGDTVAAPVEVNVTVIPGTPAPFALLTFTVKAPASDPAAPTAAGAATTSTFVGVPSLEPVPVPESEQAAANNEAANAARNAERGMRITLF